MKFLATPETARSRGSWSGPGARTHLLSHGAGDEHAACHAAVDRRSPGRVSIATFRYNFPIRRTAGRDGQRLHETIRSAVAAARKAAPDLPGGRPFLQRTHDLDGGVESPLRAFTAGLLLPAPRRASPRRNGPTTSRTSRCRCSSERTRRLAELDLLRPVCEKLGSRARLHLLDTADHGYKILKKSRTSDEDVFVEMARVARDWAAKLVSRKPG